jgi:hypothetical protein
MEELKKIESKELHYFNQIIFTLLQDIEKMIKSLNSKDRIKEDWIDIFRKSDKKRQNSDFAKGAERVYSWLFSQFGTPNSSPIGADLMFETYDAFVHIDIKTAKISNGSDYKGKVPIGENQTSYKSNNFNSNLPFYYTIHEGKKIIKKPCLTYILNVIYDDKSESFKILAVLLIAVPNGLLKKVYKEEIIGAGKSKGKSFRYEYKVSPYFKLANNKILRIKDLYLDKKYLFKNLTGINQN